MHPKLAAARQKDFRFVGALAERAALLPAAATRTRTPIEQWITTNRLNPRQAPPQPNI